MKRNLTIIVLTFIVLLAIIFLVFDLHRNSKEQLLSQFNKQQLTLAQQIASGIELNLRTPLQNIQVFSSYASLQHHDMKQIPADIHVYLEYLNKMHVKGLDVYNEKGTIIYSTNEDAIGLNQAQHDFFDWARNKENKGRVLVPPPIRKSVQDGKSPHFQFLLVTTLYQETAHARYPKPTKRFVGLVSLTVDFEELLVEQLATVSPETKQNEVWVMDKDGTLLFQSEHSDMTLRSIYQRKAGCDQCHMSFDYVKRMQIEKQGTVDYQLKNFPKKLASFASVEFENASWIVVVNTSYDQITAFLEESFRQTLVLVGTIVLILVGSSTLVHRNHRMKARAEKAMRESEARLRFLLSSTPAVIYACKPSGDYGAVYIGANITQQLGYEPEDFTSDSRFWGKHIHPEDAPRIFRQLQHLSEYGNYSHEYRFLHKDGTYRWMRDELKLVHDMDGNPLQIVGYWIDITERKQAELQNHLQSRVLDGINKVFRERIRCNTDEELGRTCITVAEELTGSKFGFIGELNESGLFDTVAISNPGWEACKDPNLQAINLTKNMEIRGIDRSTIKEGKSRILNGDEIASHPDRVGIPEGHPPVTAFLGVPLKNKGKTIGMIGLGNKESGYDAADQEAVERLSVAIVEALKSKRVEMALQESDEKYRSILANIEDGYYEVDLAGNFTFFNDSLCKIIGYAKDELMGMNNREYTDQESAKKLYQVFNSVYRTGRPARGFDWEIIRKDGIKICIEASVSLIKDSEGEQTGFRGIIRDVTERKRTEIVIREQLTFVEQNPHPVLRMKYDGTIISANDAALKEFKERMIGSSIYVHFPSLKKSFIAGITQEKPVQLELNVGNKSYLFTLKKDTRSKSFYIYGTDITDRKQAEEARLESEERFRRIFYSSNDAIFVFDPALDKILDVNPQACNMLGQSRKELLSLSISSIHPDGLPRRKLTNEIAYLTKTGKIIICETSIWSIVICGRSCMIALARDITERKRAEEKLRKLSRAVEQSPSIVMITDTKGNIEYVNPRFTQVTGYAREEVLGKNPRILKSGETPPEQYKQLWDKITSGGEWRGEFHNKKKNGELYWEHASISPITDQERVITHFLAVKEDVTERKKLETQLVDLKEFNESIVQNMEEGIVVEDANGNMTFLNPKLCEMLEYAEDELTGKRWSKIVSPKSLSSVEEESTKRERGIKSKHEACLVSKRGEEIPVIISAAPLFDNGNFNGVVSAITDVAEQKQLQEQLIQSEKLSAVGQLISGVAHELNNPLTGVMGYSQLLLGADVSDKIKQALEKINKEALRCHKIIKNLLGFARKHRPETSYVGINGIIESTLELRAYELRLNNIKVISELDENLPKTMADLYQLQQVFLNIITNAEQAMLDCKDGGNLTLKTEVVKLCHIPKGSSDGQEYIRISFTDTGAGIREENLDKIFDPFFTTKEVGKGTGLGLSLSYGIIKEHNGNIRAESKIGRGSTFIVELPIKKKVTMMQEQVSEIVTKKNKEITGQGILVVDDEWVTCDLLYDIFQKDGHRVDSARDGRIALKKIMENDYDIILLDMKMPGMNGRQVYEHFRGDKSGIAERIIFFTGDTVSEETRAFLEETENNFISKPFSIDELRNVIQKTLWNNGH